MIEFEAEILLFNGTEGGMQREGFNGMMASFSVKNELIACKIISESKLIRRGQFHMVKVELPYGAYYKEYLNKGYKFNLNHGRHTFGTGTIVFI